jgi:hypothetical protein
MRIWRFVAKTTGRNPNKLREPSTVPRPQANGSELASSSSGVTGNFNRRRHQQVPTVGREFRCELRQYCRQFLNRGTSMSISGISSNYQQQIGATAATLQQQFQQLGNALQSGNLSSAQSDFASLQAAFSQASTTSSASTSAATASSATASPVSQAFNQLASDLQSGNLTAAQKDFSSVQSGIKDNSNGTPSFPHFPHSHHHGGGGGGVSSSQDSLLQQLSEVGQNSSSSSTSLAGAQQAYSTLQQQLQQFALGGAALSSAQPVSFDA